MRSPVLLASALAVLVLATIGYFAWSRSVENCRYARAAAEDASSVGAIADTAASDRVVSELMDRSSLDRSIVTRVEAASATLARKPNFHIRNGAVEWLKRLAVGGDYAVTASTLRLADSVEVKDGFRCSLPNGESSATSPAGDAKDFFRRFPTPEGLRSTLLALDQESRAALQAALVKAVAIKAAIEARERRRRAELQAELQSDANTVCRSRGAVAQAASVYQQFLNTCNGPYGGQYYDCTQGNANSMASQVRAVADQRDRNEQDFATKWGSASLREISCY
jgi:hypothetical protein